MGYRHKKAQAAMQYLMTYGWALIVITVVLIALYGFGVFNFGSLTPKAPPGGCQVYKQTGLPSSLGGTCNNELPQFAGVFGGSQYITVNTAGFPTGSSPRTLTAWINIPSYSNGGCGQEMATGYGSGTCSGEYTGLGPDGSGYISFAGCGDDYHSSLMASLNTWVFIASTYTSGSTQVTIYMNSQSVTGSLASALSTNLGGGAIGAWGTGCQLTGKIADVQLYNASLPPADIQNLYMEGIGGVPIDLNYLVGWWPLNGNANDYSGNNHTSTVQGVTFTPNWINGYSSP
ncbi:MAG: LamG domain-containing protein [Candidatus Micrarchaeota archaeon]|nr:LamG domain-containing protein [Candidatus Micrarchaeota archaeon]